MADPAVRIVSLTVTEKGYCHDPAFGELDEAHPDIIADLAAPDRPRSAPGLAEALRLRRAAGLAPFTVLCCDNLPANGETVARVTRRFAALRDADLGAYVAGEVAFPSTMVDRIAPATTDADRAFCGGTARPGGRLAGHGRAVQPMGGGGPFPAGRPPFEAVGVEMVRDVAPFEHMKLRLLNAPIPASPISAIWPAARPSPTPWRSPRSRASWSACRTRK